MEDSRRLAVLRIKLQGIEKSIEKCWSSIEKTRSTFSIISEYDGKDSELTTMIYEKILEFNDLLEHFNQFRANIFTSIREKDPIPIYNNIEERVIDINTKLENRIRTSTDVSLVEQFEVLSIISAQQKFNTKHVLLNNPKTNPTSYSVATTTKTKSTTTTTINETTTTTSPTTSSLKITTANPTTTRDNPKNTTTANPAATTANPTETNHLTTTTTYPTSTTANLTNTTSTTTIKPTANSLNTTTANQTTITANPTATTANRITTKTKPTSNSLAIATTNSSTTTINPTDNSLSQFLHFLTATTAKPITTT